MNIVSNILPLINKISPLSFKPMSLNNKHCLEKAEQKILNKNFLTKIYTYLSLSKILSLVNSLKKDNKEETNKKLDILTLIWNHRANQCLAHPKTQEKYLNKILKSNSEESSNFTNKSITTEKKCFFENKVSDSEKISFIEAENNDSFMSNFINTIEEHILTYSSMKQQQQKEFLDKTNMKLNAEIRKINFALKDKNTMELYEKIANIIKKALIVNSIEKEIGCHIENLKKDTTSLNTIPAINSTLNVNNIDVESFFEEVFKPHFIKNKSSINPYIYKDQLNLILQNYNMVTGKKDFQEKFLDLLSRNNVLEEFNLYSSYHKNREPKIKFLNYHKLQQFIYQNGGKDISQEQFDFLHNSIDNTISYFGIVQNKKNTDLVKIYFNKNANASERLKFFADMYKLAYNKTDKDLISKEISGKITADDIAIDIGIALFRSIVDQHNDDYNIILDYLKVNKNILMSLLEHNFMKFNGDLSNKECYKNLIEHCNYLINTSDRTRLNTLLHLLNNENFDGLITSLHGRMRFVTRNLLSIRDNIYKTQEPLNRFLNSEIKKLTKEIEKIIHVKIYQYTNPESHNSGIRLKIDKMILGLTPYGGIHTIYYVE